MELHSPCEAFILSSWSIMLFSAAFSPRYACKWAGIMIPWSWWLVATQDLGMKLEVRGSYLIGNFESFQEGHKLLFDVRLLWEQIIQIILKWHLLRSIKESLSGSYPHKEQEKKNSSCACTENLSRKTGKCWCRPGPWAASSMESSFPKEANDLQRYSSSPPSVLCSRCRYQLVSVLYLHAQHFRMAFVISLHNHIG